ncbi:hypothetical protein ACIQTN_01920 [Streptomyces werraensis]|uniref:hypothetical protein n=1 Tax=Streptomyces werraensis TaxID=68284 RepID=UPI00381F22A1
MGFLKDAKASTLGAEAKKAAEKGRKVFTPFLNMPMTQTGMSGNVDDWAQMIEAVEAEGWTLAEWTVGLDAKGKPQAYPLFRRA